MMSGTRDWQHLYNSKQWHRLRANQLHRYPQCQCPHDCGGIATVVDHVKPHKGDTRLFFNRRNLQSMTKACHDKYKQSQEKGGKGFDTGCDELGRPLNTDHHWN